MFFVEFFESKLQQKIITNFREMSPAKAGGLKMRLLVLLSKKPGRFHISKRNNLSAARVLPTSSKEDI
jgi:hypothetical protein